MNDYKFLEFVVSYCNCKLKYKNDLSFNMHHTSLEAKEILPLIKGDPIRIFDMLDGNDNLNRLEVDLRSKVGDVTNAQEDVFKQFIIYAEKEGYNKLIDKIEFTIGLNEKRYNTIEDYQEIINN